MTPRSASESSCSPSFVEAARSEKTIVTVLRTTAGGAGASRGAPQ